MSDIKIFRLTGDTVTEFEGHSAETENLSGIPEVALKPTLNNQLKSKNNHGNDC